MQFSFSSVLALMAFTSTSNAFQLNGQLNTVEKPIAHSNVKVYVIKSTGTQLLNGASTNIQGEFTVNINEQEVEANDTLYAITDSGSGKVDGIQTVPQGARLLAAWTHGDIRSSEKIVINELTTVASIYTLAQFWDKTNLRFTGNEVFVRVAVSGVKNFVNVVGGEPSLTISNYFNGRMTTNLARLNSLANMVSGCVQDVVIEQETACETLYNTSVYGNSIIESLTEIAKNPWRNAESLFVLDQNVTTRIDTFYEPHITFFAPTEWSLGVKYTGGGINSPGGMDFDSNGFPWANNNFLMGSQSGTLFGSNDVVPAPGASKFSPGGTAVSPEITGFVGGGISGAGFGICVAPDDSVWISNWGGQSIAHMASNGTGLSPAETGYNMNGTLGQLQSIVSDKNGNIWVADTTNSQIIYIPQGKGEDARVVCRNETMRKDNECIVEHPFGLAIDQQGYLWISSLNGTLSLYTQNPRGRAGSFVTRVNTNDDAYHDYTMADLGANARGIAIDSKGYAWVSAWGGASVYLYAPNGTYLDSFRDVDILKGPWGIAVDGDDIVWIADFTGSAIVQMCGTNTEKCPAGKKRTGAFIGTPYRVPGIQKLTDINIDMSGSVYGADNWNKASICFNSTSSELDSTYCAGDGLVRLFGLAAPVRTPLALQWEPFLN